jgi:adenosylcobinamide-GDP ribazoletransferase
VLGSAIVVLVCALDWRRAAVAVLVALLIAAVVAAIARRRIGGATGDVYGATAELSQLGALVVFAAQL